MTFNRFRTVYFNIKVNQQRMFRFVWEIRSQRFDSSVSYFLWFNSTKNVTVKNSKETLKTQKIQKIPCNFTLVRLAKSFVKRPILKLKFPISQFSIINEKFVSLEQEAQNEAKHTTNFVESFRFYSIYSLRSFQRLKTSAEKSQCKNRM